MIFFRSIGIKFSINIIELVDADKMKENRREQLNSARDKNKGKWRRINENASVSYTNKNRDFLSQLNNCDNNSI